MREIGGYFELLCDGREPSTYREGVLLNSGRHALRWIIRTLGVKCVHVPFYTCPVVDEALAREGCEVRHYALDDGLLPASDFSMSDFVIYNNYFGVCGENVRKVAARYPNTIVDAAQAFYAKPLGRASFYSPRKFFGLPDGGIAVGEGLPSADGLERDVSYGRSLHLLKRLDCGAKSGYADFKEASQELRDAPVRAMSTLSRALLEKVDYEASRLRRIANFRFLDAHLHSTFPFAMAPDDVPMVYPFVTEDATLRTRLIEQKIYVATYWPEISGCDALRERILPLPIDQRYGESDMQRIFDCIKEGVKT